MLQLTKIILVNPKYEIIMMLYPIVHFSKITLFSLADIRKKIFYGGLKCISHFECTNIILVVQKLFLKQSHIQNILICFFTYRVVKKKVYDVI